MRLDLITKRMQVFSWSAAAALLAAASSGCTMTQMFPPTPPPTVAQLENATFNGILEQPISLSDGTYEGTPFVEGGASRPSVQLWTDLLVFGDLDGSSGDEAAVLLSESSGGSGERVYVSVVGTRDGRAVDLGTMLVGDRVKVRAVSVADGKIAIDVVEAGVQDPACCPTQLARKTYELDGDRLRLVSSDAQGRLSLDAAAGAWRLVWMDQEAPPADVETPTVELHGVRLSGFSGCNRYSGSFEEIAPGQLKATPIAGTRMACPPPNMNLEQEFLRRLERVDDYTFLAGRLALSGQRGDERFLLLFEPVPPAAE